MRRGHRLAQGDVDGLFLRRRAGEVVILHMNVAKGAAHAALLFGHGRAKIELSALFLRLRGAGRGGRFHRLFARGGRGAGRLGLLLVDGVADGAKVAKLLREAFAGLFAPQGGKLCRVGGLFFPQAGKQAAALLFAARALHVLAVGGHCGREKGAELVVHLAKQRIGARRRGRRRGRGGRFHGLFARGGRGLAGLLAHVGGQGVLHGKLCRVVNGKRGLALGLLHFAHALGLGSAQLFLALGLFAAAHLKAGLLQHALALGLFFLVFYHRVRFRGGQLHRGGLFLRLFLRLGRSLRFKRSLRLCLGRRLPDIGLHLPALRGGGLRRRGRGLRCAARRRRRASARILLHRAWQKNRLGIARALALAQPHAF